jgi:hypothetical protein
MRSKIFQEVLDETPMEVETLVRIYAELILKNNQILVEKPDDLVVLASKNNEDLN